MQWKAVKCSRCDRIAVKSTMGRKDDYCASMKTMQCSKLKCNTFCVCIITKQNTEDTSWGHNAQHITAFTVKISQVLMVIPYNQLSSIGVIFDIFYLYPVLCWAFPPSLLLYICIQIQPARLLCFCLIVLSYLVQASMIKIHKQSPILFHFHIKVNQLGASPLPYIWLQASSSNSTQILCLNATCQ